MAWNSVRLQLQVTDPRSVASEHQHRSSLNTGVYSSRFQGRSMKDPRNTSEKTARKSFSAKKALFIACGVRCVLSPRPSNCSTSSPHKDPKDRPRSSSARAQTPSRDGGETQCELKGWDVYNVMKRTEEKKRARSGIYRQRVPPDSPLRPFTVPLDNQMGHRARSTPDIPMCKILWRRKDDQHVQEDRSQLNTEDNNPNLTPLLHLYLPSSYQPQEEGEETAAQDNSISKVDEKQDVTEELREDDVTMQSQKQDVTGNKTEDERPNDFADDIRCDIADTWQNDTQKDREETFENEITEEKRPQDDNRQRDVSENQCDFDGSFNIVENKQEYDIIEKTEGIFKRTKSTRSLIKAFDIKPASKTRFPATTLTFPSFASERNPTPAVSVLPSFYGSTFGFRIRTTSESKKRTRKPSDDNRFTQPTNDTQHTIEIKGNPCLLKTRAGVPSPKIMSTERGSQAHKVKTTKTFLWGPEGPQENRTVCELQSHVNRWKRLD